jgi:hypothetical protein
MCKLFTISCIDFQNFLYPESRGNIFPETWVPDSLASHDHMLLMIIRRYVHLFYDTENL